MPPTAQSQALPLTIRVLDGPLAQAQLMGDQPKGTVQLTGRMLPYRPITFEGRQRVKTRWYPGNTQATQQVMGPVEEPSTINGMWKDRFLGNGNARRLAAMFDTIRRSGSPIELTWGEGAVGASLAGGPLYVRRGILVRFKQTIDRAQDIAWEATFEWYSQDETVAPPITAVGVENPREGFAGLVEDALAVVDGVLAMTEKPLAALTNFADDIRTSLDLVVNRAIEVVDMLEAAGAVATNVQSLPRYAGERAVDVSLKAKQAYALLRTTLEAQPLVAVEVKDSAKDTLEAQHERLVMLQQGDAAQENAGNLAAALMGQLYPEVIAEVRPPAGTDLRELALEFYGDPDLWWTIAQYNGLESSRVPEMPSGASDQAYGVQPLYIPRRQEGGLGDLREGC